MRSSMTRLRSTKKFEIVLDSNKLKWFYMSCAAALPQLDRGSDYESERHRFESYTPHHLRLKLPATGAFLLRKHRIDSNLGRGAGVKKTRSVFSPRASTPAGGRSRCGSAQRMRGILYAAPFEIKAPGNGGLFFCASLSAFVQRDDFLSTRVRFRVDVATYSRPLLLKRPIRVIFRGRASDIQAQVSRSQEALSGDARAACGTLIWRGLETLWRGSA